MRPLGPLLSCLSQVAILDWGFPDIECFLDRVANVKVPLGGPSDYSSPVVRGFYVFYRERGGMPISFLVASSIWYLVHRDSGVCKPQIASYFLEPLDSLESFIPFAGMAIDRGSKESEDWTKIFSFGFSRLQKWFIEGCGLQSMHVNTRIPQVAAQKH